MNATGSLAVMIADDEAPARRKLARFLGEHDDVEVVAEALLFLDINMPDLDGIGVAEALARAEAPPAIVFVTAFDQFAVKAFEVSALDYLLKPYDRERFELALGRARRSLEARSLPPDLAGVLATLRKEDRYVRRLLIPNDGRSFFAAAAEIVRLEAEGNNVVVFLRDGSRHAMRATLESLEARLDPAQFARVHRAHVVNIDAIREIAPWFRGDYKLTLRDGTEMAWSRRYAAKRPDLLS